MRLVWRLILWRSFQTRNNSIKRLRLFLWKSCFVTTRLVPFQNVFGVDEGIAFETPIVEFYYKNDDLDDPFINDEHVKFLQIADEQQIAYLKEETRRINELLKVWFAEIDLKLIDFKLEFGFDKDGKIILADEFSPDNCRLWDTDGNHMDKDVFRRGLGELTDVYEIVWEKLQELK